MALDIILMGVTYCVHANAIKYMNQATYQTSLVLKRVVGKQFPGDILLKKLCDLSLKTESASF